MMTIFKRSFVVLIMSDEKHDLTNRKKLTRQAYGQDFVSLPKQTKIGGIDHTISISVKVTKGCVANIEMLVSWTAESLTHNQHKIIKRNNKIINVETEMSRYNDYHMA
jgi:hypothetical protein